MQLQLYNQLYKNTEMASILNEPEHIRGERESIMKTMTVLKNAQKVLKRDPE